MWRVSRLLDVGTFMKIAATVGVALFAFVAMANPAGAQETTLSVKNTWGIQGGTLLEPGSSLTYSAVVTNVGGNEAEGVNFAAVFSYQNTGVPRFVSASTTAGTCNLVSAPIEVLCDLGDLAPGAMTTVTIVLVPPLPGWSTGEIDSLAVAEAENAPRVYFGDEAQLAPVTGLPGGSPPPVDDTPKSKQECKEGGWEDFEDAAGGRAFKNQGLCIKAVNHAG